MGVMEDGCEKVEECATGWLRRKETLDPVTSTASRGRSSSIQTWKRSNNQTFLDDLLQV
jgi:hypothetical protein